MPSSLRCPNCGLLNFVNAEVCKRCKNPIVAVLSQSGSDAPSDETPDGGSTRLFPCPDCRHSCSLEAAACPNCGRTLGSSAGIGTKIIGIIALCTLLTLFVGYYLFNRTPAKAGDDTTVHSQIADAAATAVSSRNAAAIKSARNAIGEIESVIGVGINYPQYTSALQSAKIKFDAAVRDIDPQSPSDIQSVSNLNEAFDCYRDGASAWGEFVQRGDEYGFLDSANSVVWRLESKYGYHSSDRQYFKNSVIRAIWNKCLEKATSTQSAEETNF